jgi:pyruvate,water dikinase
MLVIREQNWRKSQSELGGKAQNLFLLRELKTQVPPLFVVGTEAYKRHSEKIPHFKDLLLELESEHFIEKARALRQAIINEPLQTEIFEDLKGAFGECFSEEDFVAVRSSALGEDSKEQSFAGQMDSFLFCQGIEDIAQALKKCWASLFSDRAITYRKMAKLTSLPEIAVVVQKMVEGSRSGVCFSRNPLSQEPNELLVTATFGLGEGIVSGALNTDQWILDRNTFEVLSVEITEKDRLFKFDEEHKRGTCEVDCPTELRSKASLSEEDLRQLAKEALRIEKAFQCPQDIEFTFQGDELFILQTRPITTLMAQENETRQIENRAYETIWDNSNIVESYSGVTTPLTYSFANHCYYMVYVQFCEVLGVPREKIQKLDFNFKNMLGLIHGRIYYNLKNWYRLISVLPGYEYNKTFMEQMMGVKEEHRLAPGETLIEEISSAQKYLVELPRLLWVGANLTYQFFALDRKVKRFIDVYEAVYFKYKDQTFETYSLHQIVSAYDEMERRVLRNWKPPIINDFMAMIFYGVLKSIILKWNLDQSGSLQNQLLGGQGNVESTLPIKRLEEIADVIRSDAKLSEAFKLLDRVALKEKLLGPNAVLSASEQGLRSQIKAYLDEYGFRCMNELKLEEPSLKDQPEFLFSILKNYSLNPKLEDQALSETEAQMAYENVRETLKKNSIWGLSIKWQTFKFVLNFAKKAVKVREYQRFARTKMFGVMRTLFRAAGKKLHELSVLSDPKDVFYLTKDELFGFVAGASVTFDLKNLVEMRKKEFETYKKEEELPDRITTRGAVYLSKNLEIVPAAPLAQSEGILKGTSCSPGKIRGRVKVILSPSDDMNLNGEILVAGRTDPGWVTLYPSASGLLIERGSVLSHSAIVARELRLPAIVGIPNITKILKTGDLVEMDGEKGIVTKLSEVSSEIEPCRNVEREQTATA